MGRRVTAYFYLFCGTCDECTAGLEHRCRNLAGLVGVETDGGYEPFVYKRSLGSGDIEIADDVYLIVRERAEEYVAKKAAPPAPTGFGAARSAHRAADARRHD